MSWRETDAQALHFNERAGIFAVAQFAHAEAIRYLTRALALAPDDDLQRRFTLLARREDCYAAIAQPEPRLADLTEMKKLAQRLLEQNATLPDAKPMIVTLTRLGWYFSDAGQAEPAIAALQQAITLAHDAGEHALETEARSMLGAGYFLLGRLEAARRELLPAVEGAIDAAPSVSPRQIVRIHGRRIDVFWRHGRGDCRLSWKRH